MYIKVKNLKGTSDNKPRGYNSWLEYWEEKKGKTASNCTNINCRNSSILGGHVKKVFGGNEWYITPLCYSCNNSNDEFYVEETNLLRVNQ